MKSRLCPMLLLVGVACSGCAGMAPVLTEAVVAFGQQLIGNATANYTPQYAQSMNGLLLAMAEIATGQPFTQQTVYNPPGGYYPGSQSNDPYAQTGYPDTYPQSSYPTQNYPEQTYPEQTYPTQNYPDPNYPNQTYPDQTYPDQTYPQPAYETTTGGYPNSSQPYDPGVYPQQPAGDYGQFPTNYQTPTYAPASYSIPPQAITLDVSLLAQSLQPDGTTTLRPIQDGEILRDGGNNPAAGDKIKLHFRANCDCYLYIINIDATGWVTQILPEAGQRAMPVAAGQAQIIPSGDEWWALDAYKGVEQIYFILSRTQRFDLEAALSRMPVTRTDPPSTGYQPVTAPAYLATRGMVKVHSSAPASVPTQQGVQTVVSDTFVSDLMTGDLVLTRWFQHL